MKIAYICYQSGDNFAAIEGENLQLLSFLEEKGLSLQQEIWDDPEVDWSQYDLALLKAPWDYFDKHERFIEWLNKLKSLNVRLLNPVDTVKWNSDKHYMQEIADAGLEIVPTVFIEKGEQPDFQQYFDQFGGEKIIVKPAVSGGAKNTFALRKSDLEEFTPKLHEMLKTEAFMVQPFLKEIQQEGEYSLMFFNGTHSHSLLKTAKSGDFRVQHVHGGSIHPLQPEERMLNIARKYVEQFAKGCLYARVDGVMIDGTFQLMELELIEPFHYLETSENGFENYYQALMEMTQKEMSL